MHVLERPAAAGRAADARASLGAGVADTHDQHLGAHRLEAMALLEVLLQLGDEFGFDVQDPPAELTDRVLVGLRGDLVVDRPVAQPNRVQGAGGRQRLQGAIHRAA